MQSLRGRLKVVENASLFEEGWAVDFKFSVLSFATSGVAVAAADVIVVGACHCCSRCVVVLFVNV